MSMENVKEFLALVKTDEGLARKVVELKDSLQDGANLGNELEILAEKVLPLAKAHGLEFTVEEFLEYSNSMAGELSDDDLLNVSGGLSARGVALGLLFATGLSFVPSILSSFAEGPGGSAPAAPETSYSQSYSSELEENSAMELKEREAEKEVRSSRDDVRRAGNQVRTAQKRVKTLKLKLPKEFRIDDINALSKKQKKKFSKLINQIAMAEEDLSAAQQKLEASKEQTDTAEKVKAAVKENNTNIIKERKERVKKEAEEKARKEEEERITREKQAEEWWRKVNLSKKRAQKNKMTSRSAIAKYAEDIELEALSAKVIEKINERLASCTGQDDVYGLRLKARRGEISIGKTADGDVITVEDLKKYLEDLELNELEEARIKQIENLLSTYSGTMSTENKTMLETQKKNISEGKMNKQLLTNLGNTLNMIEGNLKKEAEIKEKKGALNGMLGHLYNTQAKSELQARLNEVNVDNVTIHDGQELIDSLNEIEKKIVEAEQQQKDKIKDLSKELNEINDTIDGMYYDGKDTEDLSQNYNTLKTKMNSGNFDLTQVENEIDALYQQVKPAHDQGTKRNNKEESVLNNNELNKDRKDAQNNNANKEKNVVAKKTNEEPLKARLEKISDELDGLFDNKNLDTLNAKYNAINHALEQEKPDLKQIENDIAALDALIEDAKSGKSHIDLSRVEFAGETLRWDGTIENLYNCLKAADFDIDRIKDSADWTESCKKALKAMTVKNNTLQISTWSVATGSCGTGTTDYKHKAMLKILALFAMEGYKQESSAKQVADPSSAKAEDVKIDDIDGLKKFVESKK